MKLLATLPLTLASMLAVAVAASAATVTAERACYRESEVMTLTVAGFPDGDVVDFFSPQRRLRMAWGPDGEEELRVGDGVAHVQVLAEDVSQGRMAFDVQAVDYHNNDDGSTTEISATVGLQLVDGFQARALPRTAKPRRKVRYRISGATELTPVYLHVTRQRNGPRPGRARRKTIKLGTPTGPCGDLEVRVPQLAGMAIRRHSVYSRQIDLSPKPDQSPSSFTRANLAPVFVP